MDMQNIRQIEVMAGVMAVVLIPAGSAVASEGTGGPNLFTGDLGNIIWSLVTFGAVILVLGKFAWKPVLGALQKREDFIRESLEKAKADREQAEVRLKEYTDRIEAARTEARDIVEEGRRDAEVVKQKIAEEAQAQATASIERGKREIAIATDSAIKDLYALGTRIATDAASQIIRKELNPEDHERLVAESIEQLEKLN